jgi:ABC-type glycerol-3-phosphate transport system substrate-binding protein
MAPSSISRRSLLASATAATAVVMGGPFVRGAHAAGKLRVGFWDHWVPGANATLSLICEEWAAAERVDLAVDFIPLTGDKLVMTAAAEAQAGSGHDVLSMQSWVTVGHGHRLEPVDDLMRQLVARNGAVHPACEYLGRLDGAWIAVPATVGGQLNPPCARIDLVQRFAGLDVTRMYPAGGPPDPVLAAQWTWERFLEVARRCAEGGYPFGMPLGSSTDATDWVGAVFASHGARLVAEDGTVTVDSEPVRHVLEYFRRLVPYLPADVFGWDGAGNNKWLISGKGALIMNPPSAWAVAKRDARETVAAHCWTFPSPKGPQGRFESATPCYWGIWSFSPNKSAAKSLLAHLSTRAAAQRFVAASSGSDIPPWNAFLDFQTWAEVGPPPGTLYSYPPRYPDQIVSVACAPAPKQIANQLYAQATMTKMIARCTQAGGSVDQAIGWAAKEIEGFMRT